MAASNLERTNIRFILSIIHVPVIRCKSNSSLPIGLPPVLMVSVMQIYDPFPWIVVGALLTLLTCVLEITSAILTTIRGVQALRISGMPRTPRNGFVFLVHEQGVLYFCVTSMFTLASLIIGVIIPGGFFQRLLSAFTLPVSGLLTARFFLHIRRWEDKYATRRTTDDPLTSTNIEFTTIMTSIWSLADEFGDDPVFLVGQEMDRGRAEDAYDMHDLS
ncbi:hypothetical protein D9615_006291 [Tricholomella constricta]|uniref:Uncharacterized protein n=1 Tax=Tricholomella constricta TaxID=117010 RepID=A0A8H5M434_9AGAR|nr:hypothetical protein D9615_006291 [Tricholomella constricta]